MRWKFLMPLSLVLASGGCAEPPIHDLVIRNGTLYDGLGGAGVVGDVAVDGDRIVALGDVGAAVGRREVDASGLAVTPGFINLLSWANESLIQDGRSLSDISQGVTLEVFGEGRSMGPLGEATRAALIEAQGDIRYDVEWTTLAEYLQYLEDRGVSTNVASLVGAATVRANVVGFEDRPATAEELERMREQVRAAMEEGAMGVGSALVYAPGSYASTDELVALAEIAAEYDGLFTAHVRGEGKDLLPAIDEMIDIVRRSGVRGEIYHLKASGQENWSKFEQAVAKIEAARAEGLPLGADIYPYRASSTGLDIMFPGWVKEGGHQAFVERLRDPEVRSRLSAEMDMIPAQDVMLVSFKNEELRSWVGKTLADWAEHHGVSPEIAAMDLIVADDSRVGTVRFTMSEDNVRRALQLPWIAFCSDSGSMAPEPPFTNGQPHPRAYGSFARILGHYSRDLGLLPLEEAIRRMTSLPAERLGLDDRGRLAPGALADVVVFDPATIIDRATFEAPHQLAVGVRHVWVNGVEVIREGAHTGATPGRFVRGPETIGTPIGSNR